MADVLSPERSTVEPRRRSVSPPHSAWAAAGVAVVVFWIAYDKGSYPLQSRTGLAIAVWWALGLGVAVGIWPIRSFSVATVRVGVLLTGFAGWTAASALWVSDTEAAYEEFMRVLLYVGVFALAVAAAPLVRRAPIADGIAVAVTGVAVVALVARCFPSVISPGSQYRFLPVAQTRLSFPIGYWNGMGIFLALGLPLLLRLAAFASPRLVRACAAGAFPIVAVALYLTSSRGGFVTAAAGSLAFFALAPRRLVTTAVLLVAGGGSAVAVAFVRGRTAFVNDPTASAATGQGHSAAVIVLACALGVAAAYAAVDRYLLQRRRESNRLDRALLVAVVVLLTVGTVAANPVQRFRDFKQTPSAFGANDYVTAHLLSGSGNGRWQYWSAAFNEFKDHPVLGGGAGSFREYWEEHRDVYVISIDAHSLYPEVLGELGLIGFALVVGALGVGLVAGIRRARSSPGRGAEGPALAATFAAFVVALGVDWMWELTAVAIVGFVVLGTLLESERDAVHERFARPATRFRVLVGAASAVVIFLQALPMLADLRLDDSRAAAGRGDNQTALRRADDARRLTPWAASPYLQLALVYEQAGQLAAAQSDVEDAVERDPRNWSLWIVRARLETKSGAIPAALRGLDRARVLNPFAAALPSG